MTSLLPHLGPQARGSEEIMADLRHRRPLVLVATLGGVLAALGALVVLCALVLVGWFLTDSGSHGTPGDAVQIGSVAWLVAHGSGVHASGSLITMVPLGLVGLVGCSLWRSGVRVGDAISDHGPDADRLADGERDWTVPIGAGLFTVGYALTVTIVGTLTSTTALGIDVAGATMWAVVLAAVVGGLGISVGSGRAAIWAMAVPGTIRVAALIAWKVVLTWLAVCTVAVVAALLLDFSTAANLMDQLGTSGSQGLVYVLAMLLIVPNAVIFGGAFLLGPGFTVGTGTLVAPSGVVLGPLPMVPLLAALPDAGPQPAWMAWLVLVPALVAAAVVARVQRQHPTTVWTEGLIRGLAGGVGAGLLFGILAHWSGGAVGPGRMVAVAPHAMDATVKAVTTMGIGGMVGGLAMTWWQRRAASAR
ncbi:DUF6350 family protein [Nocardioides sp.]|uniref:cell division protein PerM n=1 Tax=Nocardioides sp. TaxID=35761 RepID=UPI002630EC64|nr:DUF6350 family protein [Nocardioides sp.]